jgi:death-on-curing protein
MLDYISLPDALAIHQVMIRKYGGSDGIRDMGALESALMRPQSGYYEDIIFEAAALFESLIINHPFIDGNKRVAFAATDIFLRINGYQVTAMHSEIHVAIMEFFDTGTCVISSIEPWLRSITDKP